MTSNTDNKALVSEYMEAFRTFDTARYFPFLAEHPTYIAGVNVRHGRAAFKANTDAGRVLYPRPAEAQIDVIAMIAEGDWVAVLLRRRAATNKIENYENVYGFFYEVRDGKIQTQVELLDFRVAAEAFDLSVLPGHGEG